MIEKVWSKSIRRGSIILLKKVKEEYSEVKSNIICEQCENELFLLLQKEEVKTKKYLRFEEH